MRLLTLLTILTLLALPVGAQVLSVHDSDFEVSAGGAVTYAPDYLGSDDYELGFEPRGEITFQKVLFLSTRNGAGVYIFNDKSMTFGVAVAPDFGRDEDDNDHLTGLGDIDFGWNLNIFLDGRFEPFETGVSLRRGFAGGSEGFVIGGYLGLRDDLAERLTGHVRASLSWADTQWTGNYFGVSSVQSAASGLPAYQAGDGFSQSTLSAGLSYALTPNVSLDGTVRYSRLLGDAKDSPVTRDPNQFSVMIGASYSWPAARKP